MNWIFETYSNVYSAAMMQDVNHVRNVAVAKKNNKLRGTFARLLGRQ